ncbi:MAG: hypothetical protein MI810_18980 [Flavobacteriales bacterium]|jgi:hypothetical protein|nr:hypothetical protein [Flavobacteriales bacterium]
MKSILNSDLTIDPDFAFRTIASVEEISNHDMIYIYHHIKVGKKVKLSYAGTNVKGDLRWKVEYKNFMLGYITLGGFVKHFYEGQTEIHGEIVSLSQKKHLPIQELDIEIQPLKLKKVG